MANATVLYIAGAARSGSTLISRTLGTFTGCANVGELKNIFAKSVLFNERCGCGSRFDACPFWRQVGQRAFGGWDKDHARRMVELRRIAVRRWYLPMLLLGSAETTPHWREAQEYVQTFGRLYRAISEVTGAAVIVDASKSPVHGIYMCRGRAADIRPLQLVRDPRGVAFSWSKEILVRPQADPNGIRPTMLVLSARQAARMWSRANFWGRVLRTQARSTIVRYEDFIQAPVPCLAQALRSLDLDAPEIEHSFQRDLVLEPTHGIGGIHNRFNSGRIELRVDDAWRRELPLIQRYVVDARTVPVRGMLAIDRSRRRASYAQSERPGSRKGTRPKCLRARAGRGTG